MGCIMRHHARVSWRITWRRHVLYQTCMKPEMPIQIVKNNHSRYTKIQLRWYDVIVTSAQFRNKQAFYWSVHIAVIWIYKKATVQTRWWMITKYKALKIFIWYKAVENNVMVTFLQIQLKYIQINNRYLWMTKMTKQWPLSPTRDVICVII
jgi:hypothetical protein